MVVAQTGYYYNAPPVTPGGNPGNLNGNWENPYGNGLSSTWTDIQSATHPSWTAVQTIPFSFNFNGTPVTNYKVSTTGILTFTTTATLVPGITLPIPSPAIPDKSICIWGLKYGGSNTNDHIVKKTFGTAPNRQHWVFFASYDIQNGNNDCWTYWSIVLEETTNKIYIVDQRNSTKQNCEPYLTLGIQINSTTAIQVAGSPVINALAGKSKTPSDNKYYEFIPGVRPQYDMSVDWIQTNHFQTKGVLIEIRGTLKNFGAVNTTSYNVNYQFDNGPVITEKVAIANIPMLAGDWYFHDTLWDPDTVGIYHLKVWCDSINGHADQNVNNDTCYKTIEVMGVFVPRLVFHEVFTSATSDECKIGNDSLKIRLDANPGSYSLIKYQMPNDSYSTPDGLIRKTYYGIDSLPDMFINGIHQIDPSYYNQMAYESFSAPAYLQISPTFSRNGNTVTVSAAILPFPEWSNTSTNLKIHMAVVEKITHNNTSTNGETEFYNVLKKMLPDANGVSIGILQPGVYVNKSSTYTFPSGHTIEDINRLQAIVFIQDDVTKEVIQSSVVDIPNSISEIEQTKSHIVSFFPNPANKFANMNYMVTEEGQVNIKVYNVIGDLVYTKKEGNKPNGIYSTIIPTHKFNNGLYILKLSVGNTIFTKKFTVDN